jgi:hypothetical protein
VTPGKYDFLDRRESHIKSKSQTTGNTSFSAVFRPSFPIMFLFRNKKPITDPKNFVKPGFYTFPKITIGPQFLRVPGKAILLDF